MVSDSRMDFDSDGRFNIRDVQILSDEIGNATTGDFANVDFDKNSLVDALDVGILQALVDAGLDSGIFGDANNDGVLNCADRGAAPSTWDLIFGDAGYKVALDIDLDGDNDSLDQAAFDGMTITADVDFNNDSSSFDPQDIDAFLSVYEEGPCVPETATCDSVDFNGDGSFYDPADIVAFMAAYSSGEC